MRRAASASGRRTGRVFSPPVLHEHLTDIEIRDVAATAVARRQRPVDRQCRLRWPRRSGRTAERPAAAAWCAAGGDAVASTMASMPATVSSADQCSRPRLLAPIRITATFGAMPATSPFSMRHSRCEVASPLKPRLTALRVAIEALPDRHEVAPLRRTAHLVVLGDGIAEEDQIDAAGCAVRPASPRGGRATRAGPCARSVWRRARCAAAAARRRTAAAGPRPEPGAGEGAWLANP